MDQSIPTLPIKVNKKVFDAYIDTGGYFSLSLSPQTFDDIDSPLLKNLSRSKDTDGNVKITLQKKTSVEICDSRIENIVVERFVPWGGFLQNTPTSERQYIVGLGLLKKFPFLIDLENGLFSMDKHLIEHTINCKESLRLPCSMTENGIEINLIYQNKCIKGLIDTGCSKSIIIIKKKFQDYSDYLNMDNMVSEPLQYYSERNEIFYPIQPIFMNLSEPDVDIILGCDFLMTYKTVFDLSNKILYLTPS